MAFTPLIRLRMSTPSSPRPSKASKSRRLPFASFKKQSSSSTVGSKKSSGTDTTYQSSQSPESSRPSSTTRTASPTPLSPSRQEVPAAHVATRNAQQKDLQRRSALQAKKLRRSGQNRSTQTLPSPVITIGGGFRSSLQRSDPSTRLVVPIDGQNFDDSDGESDDDSAHDNEQQDDQQQPFRSSRNIHVPQDDWKPTGVFRYHCHSPVLANTNGIHKEMKGRLESESESEVNVDNALAMAMARSRRLPGTWYFSSGHVMINKERAKACVAPLVRQRELDEQARAHAAVMAAQQYVHHSSSSTTTFSSTLASYRRMGENVASGDSIRSMQREMVKASLADKNNMLDRRYTHMGMGTARGADGRLYMCQLFRG